MRVRGLIERAVGVERAEMMEARVKTMTSEIHILISFFQGYIYIKRVRSTHKKGQKYPQIEMKPHKEYGPQRQGIPKIP